MKVFLDANVIISVLNKEYPLFTWSAKILSLGQKSIELCTSPVCIAIAFYFSSKKSGEVQAKKKLSILLDHIKITPTDHICTTKAVQNPQIHDPEDFYFSEITVSGSEYFLKNYL